MTIKAQVGPVSPDGRTVRMDVRISREDLYMEIARLFSRRSTCLRGQVGCVAVKDKHIIAAGYNGSPPGMPHCLDVGCGGGVTDYPLDGIPQTVFPNGCTRAIHAEANMVAFAARVGVSLEGSAVYTTHGPCLPCAQVLVASGIGHLCYEMPYRLPQGLELIGQTNIEVMKYGN